MTNNKKEIMSASTHFMGAILGLVGSIFLVHYSLKTNEFIQIISFVIYGIGLVFLYSASSIYHITDSSKQHKKLLRKIDHMMIFVLIAATYTPICLNVLKGDIGRNYLIVIWSLAAIGMIIKIFWIEAPRWLVSTIYILMGWAVIFAISPLYNSLPKEGMFWLVLGGIIYTAGGVIYGTKKPNITTEWFGFHEIFHLFVLGGSLCHYILMFKYILIH